MGIQPANRWKIKHPGLQIVPTAVTKKWIRRHYVNPDDRYIRIEYESDLTITELGGKLTSLGHVRCEGLFEMSAYNADPKAEHLLRLSDEVGRIAGKLARLSAVAEADEPDNDVEIEIDPDVVRSIIRARRMRANFFSGDLFSDPAWDIILELFHAELSQRRVAIMDLSQAANVPASTALRWLTTLVDNGVCSRRADPLDRRRVYIEITPKTSRALRRYFSKLGIKLVL